MAEELNTGLELDIDLHDDELETQWNNLIKEIIKGNVIPVIGPDFLIADNKNLHTQIIEFLARKLKIGNSPKTFSQLIYDKDFPGKKNKIYRFVNQVVTALGSQKTPNELLVKLLETKRFPFVITTSFTPIVEQVMKNVWDKEPRVLTFKNDPNNDKAIGKGDVRNSKEMAEPTIFYMFGKSCDCDMHPDFVLTDLDMMQFCSCWVSGIGTPPVLTNIIKDRYLLVLGNNYSDWLLRFIWFSLRSNEKLSSSLFVKECEDDELMSFLNRLEVFTQTNPETVVNEIRRRLSEFDREEQVSCSSQDYDTDVFISYSHSDKKTAERLMKVLSDKGLSVWLDNHGGIVEAEYWRAAIVRGIKSCRIFVPLLTTNIEAEFAEEHEYRTEWNIAASRSSKMGNIPFIFPLAEKGFNFYNELTDIPTEFSEINAVWFDLGSDMNSIAEKINKKVETVKSYIKR